MIGATSLPVALAVGLILRLVWVGCVAMVPFSDPGAYEALARNLLAHGVYGFEPGVPSATWPPGTSAFYAAVFALPGPDYLAAKTINVGISVLNIWLVWLVGRALFDARVGLWAAWAMALWPQMIFFTTLPASEPLFLSLMLAGVAAWERGRRSTSGQWLAYAAFAGVLLALATYVRSVALLLPLALVIGEVGRRGDKLWRIGARLVVAGAVMAAMIAPWSQRNLEQFGTPIVMSSNFGANLYLGNGPGSTGRFGTAQLPDGLDDLSYIERSDRMGELAKEIIRNDPAAFVLRSLSKLVIIHDRETIGVAWNQQALRPLIGETGLSVLKTIATGYWLVVLVGGLMAILWHLFRGLGWRILFSVPLAAWGYFSSIHAIILAGDRFHIPQSPFIAILAASALVGVLTARRDAQT